MGANPMHLKRYNIVTMTLYFLRYYTFSGATILMHFSMVIKAVIQLLTRVKLKRGIMITT